jgi:TetR/AcrR family transcriptional regulator
MRTTSTALSIRRSTEDRQQEIVLTVLALAAERGVDAITTQAIADRIGLTQGALFRHFPTKGAIWSAVLDWLVAQMEELFGAAEALPPLAALEQVFEAYMALFARFPAVPRLFFADTFHHPYPRLHARLQAMVRSCEERLANWIRQAQKAGAISPVSSPGAAKLLLTCIQGLAFQTCVLGIVEDPEATGRKLFPLYLAALGITRRRRL